ncbi:hypothetical protein [Sphingomonas sp. DBB INV C78]|uniref:hypothetical protein n=1 Tax=Sphingomonas sp. DBB INV C78 TaxID=3349434 RepID=UPI0036D31E5D
MRREATGWTLAALGMLASTASYAQTGRADLSDEQRERIERDLGELKAMRHEFDARIEALEAELHSTPPPTAVAARPLIEPGATPTFATPPGPIETASKAIGGAYEPGKGMVLARGDEGELDFSAFSYMRYLNQNALDDTYVDSFGRTKALDLRQDLQLQKVMLYFKGWLFDPKFRYLFYAWTSNTSQGQGAQVVLGGNIGYNFSDNLMLYAGIASLPTTRSTNLTFPNWLKSDNRTIADDFFRGSFTTGIWAQGCDHRWPELSGDGRQQSESVGCRRNPARRRSQHLFRRTDLDADDRRIRPRAGFWRL